MLVIAKEAKPLITVIEPIELSYPWRGYSEKEMQINGIAKGICLCEACAKKFSYPSPGADGSGAFLPGRVFGEGRKQISEVLLDLASHMRYARKSMRPLEDVEKLCIIDILPRSEWPK